MTTPADDRLVARSLELIRAHQAPSGGYFASPTFPTYRYSWFRDGAFIADAMSRWGEIDSAESFFGWCGRILEERRERVLELVAASEQGGGGNVGEHEHLHTRYTVDGEETGERWENFQLDGYGAWLWALDAHSRRHGRDPARYLPGAELSVRYLVAYWDQPCYDWWEEHREHRHPSSLAAVQAGLVAAASWDPMPADVRNEAARAAKEIEVAVRRDGIVAGRLTKWFGNVALDASLIACATPFRLLPPTDPVMTATVDGIERELTRGGVYRYLADTFYGGGEWVLLAGLLGWYHAEIGAVERARRLQAWIEAQADAEGNLPEQVDTNLLYPDRKADWDRRWGPSARPLLWSHAMYLTLRHAIDAGQTS